MIQGSTDVFQGFGNEVLTLQICLYWAAVLISTLIALKHLMPVSSMWPTGPLIDYILMLYIILFHESEALMMGADVPRGVKRKDSLFDGT